MTFDLTGLLIFLLAIVPGFLAQQSRHSVVPRSLEQKSALEETGEYVVDSLFVHLFFLTVFRLLLGYLDSSALFSLAQAVSQKKLPEWGWDHRYLVLAYLISTLAGGFAFGFIRGILALNQPVRKGLGGYHWFSRLLNRLGIHSFLQTEPVWYGVLRQSAKDESTFVEVRMKGEGGYYTGELKSYGILEDSKREKDFYLVNVYFRERHEKSYRKLEIDGILLNFADAECVEVMKRSRNS
jgi:MFS family permease